MESGMFKRSALSVYTERLVETILFSARWIMAPIYLGLVSSLLLIAIVFCREVVSGIMPALHSQEATILLVLSLIDLSLAANLVLIVTLAGYENFVSKIDNKMHEDRPSWMGTIDFSAMKIKLIASVVAISAISLLRQFLSLSGHGNVDETKLIWLVVLHVTFMFSGVMFAAMDLVAAYAHKVAGATVYENSER